jgi:filamentous hemagglutinin family protein
MKQGMFLFSRIGHTSIALAMLVGTSVAFAAPQGGQTAAGRAAITQKSLAPSSTKTDIWQSTDKAVIDWRSFDMGAGDHTQFHQPSSKSFTLNRVKDTDASRINGKLTANGNIAIVNPNGVYFGRDAKVDVNGIIATTADIDNQRFMRGEMKFDKPGTPNAAVINEGSITARQAGLVGLVAPNVLNNGTITARMGTIQLASGDSFTVDLYGNGLMEVQVSDKVQQQLLSNSGKLHAEGGTIALTAAAGKTVVNSLVHAAGELKAPAVSKRGGKIIIAAEGSNAVKGNTTKAKGKKSGNSVVVVQNANLDASGYGNGQTGGQIDITGDHIEIGDNTLIDTSGDAGGGSIRIGGDYLGTGDTPAARYVYASPSSLTLNNALTSGNGGRTIYWSDDTTEFWGNVIARGGRHNGNGGFVETSGKKNLLAQGWVDLTAPRGLKGTYLLDPDTITILGGFDPLDYTGLSLWLDADDTSTITHTAGAVTQWNDKSGEGNHAYAQGSTNPTTGLHTLNGRNVVYFNGTDNTLTVLDDDSLGGTSGLTMFVLNTPTLNGSPHGILSKRSSQTTNQAYSLFYYNGNKVNSDIPGSSSRFASNASAVSGSVNLLGLHYDGTKPATSRVDLYMQGLFDTSGRAGTATIPDTSANLYIGALNQTYGQYLNADIPEILIYNTSLSKAQQDVVNQYLSAKWDFALNPTSASSAEHVEAMSSAGYSTFTTGYLKRLSSMADIALQADNGVTLDLQGETLTLDDNRSISIATTNGDISTASAGTIKTNKLVSGGNIALTATNGDIVANHSMILEAVGGGTVSLTAGGNINSGGRITLRADDVMLDGPVIGNTTWLSDASTPTLTTTATGTGRITFRPRTSGRSLAIGASSGADVNLSSATINAMQNAFGRYAFGHNNTTGVSNHVSNWNGDLTITTGGDFTNSADINSTQIVTVNAGDDIILNNSITTSDPAKNALILSAGGNFTNNAGASALSATGTNGRWIVYSAGPSGNTRDGLLPDTSEFGKTRSSHAPNTFTGDNYFVYATATAPTITYNVDDQTVEYGDAIGSLSATYDSGLVGDDSLTNIGLSGAASFATTYSAGDDAGTYAGAITAAANTLASPLGYAFNFVAGDAIVDQAPLTVTLTDNTPSRQAGQANPAFALSYSGFKLLQDASVLDTAPTASSPANVSSPAGSYDITISGGADNNYLISYLNPAGNLTVTAVPRSPSPQPAPVPAPTPQPAPTPPAANRDGAVPPTVTRVSQDPGGTQTLMEQASLLQSNPAPQTIAGDESQEQQNEETPAENNQNLSLNTLAGMVEIRPELIQRFQIHKSNMQFQSKTGHEKRSR